MFDPSTVVRAFDVSTGQKRWATGPGNTSVGTAAAIAGGQLFLLTSTPNSTVFAFNAATGPRLWKTPVGCGQSIAAEGSVVAVSHSCDVFPTVVFLNAANGAKTGEGCEGDPDAEGYAGPTLRNGVAYFVSNDTHVVQEQRGRLRRLDRRGVHRRQAHVLRGPVVGGLRCR